MSQDLRSYLELVESKDDLVRIAGPVDPRYEVSALVAKLARERRRRPVFLLENVKGSALPVVTNLHASRRRMALAMNAEPREVQRTFLKAMERPVAPVVVDGGPVKEVVHTGSDVDLLALPQIVHHAADAGPYITAAISFARDPEDGTWNCAYNRLMIMGKDRTSIHITASKHLWEFYRKAEARGEALPVAFAVGVHPAIGLGALAIGSIDEDERAIMGGVLGEPLELVRCGTSDLLVPAHAEIVLEGEILPGERTPEGPFSEFTGYSLGERQREVVRYNAVTMREGALFHDISVAQVDHLLLSTIPMEANLYRAVRAIVPSVTAVRVPAPYSCYVAIEQRISGQAKNAILAVLGADMYIKRVVVVDHDVDIFDDREVAWALGTRCQADRDITVISNTRGSDLDPSTDSDGYTAKWGVDATAKPSLAEYTPRNRIPRDVLERIDLDKLGL
ncbi:MAG: UbiD family decarboxylase [Deltaproteobacteria bacterium]|nr:UbiD family decarboxylase [Deltaproteobacteria bacterium]